EQQWITSYYLGTGVAALALLACWRVREGRVRIFAIIALCSLLLALGNEGLLYPFAKRILPFIGIARYPIKFVVPGSLALAVLAGLAVKWINEQSSKELKRVFLRILVLILLTSSGIVFFSGRFL